MKMGFLASPLEDRPRTVWTAEGCKHPPLYTYLMWILQRVEAGCCGRIRLILHERMYSQKKLEGLATLYTINLKMGQLLLHVEGPARAFSHGSNRAL